MWCNHTRARSTDCSSSACTDDIVQIANVRSRRKIGPVSTIRNSKCCDKRRWTIDWTGLDGWIGLIIFPTTILYCLCCLCCCCLASCPRRQRHLYKPVCGSPPQSTLSFPPPPTLFRSAQNLTRARLRWQAVDVAGSPSERMTRALLVFLPALAGLAAAGDLNRQFIIFNEKTPDVFYCPQVRGRPDKASRSSPFWFRHHVALRCVLAMSIIGQK